MQHTESNAEKKVKLTKIVFGLNGVLFLMGGVSLLEEGKTLLATIQLVAAGTNLAMIPRFIPDQKKRYLGMVVLAMNVVVNGSIFYDNLVAGKNYIQYVWLLAAVMSLVALVVMYRKEGASSGSEKG